MRRITEIEMVAFSDYRLVGTFMDACAEDVSNLSCGRVEQLGKPSSYLSQGKVKLPFCHFKGFEQQNDT